MKKLVSYLGLAYLGFLLYAVPAIIYNAVTPFFFPVEDPYATVVLIGKLIFWVVLGGLTIYLLGTIRLKKIRLVATSVTPAGFIARFEILGPHANEYLAISPSTFQLIVVDLDRKVARCEPTSFIQSYNVEDGERQAILTVCFADFDFSTITFRFGRRARHEITAKLENALQWR